MLRVTTPLHSSEEKLEGNISQRKKKNNMFGIELKEIYTTGENGRAL